MPALPLVSSGGFSESPLRSADPLIASISCGLFRGLSNGRHRKDSFVASSAWRIARAHLEISLTAQPGLSPNVRGGVAESLTSSEARAFSDSRMRLGGFVIHGNSAATLGDCLDSLQKVCD